MTTEPEAFNTESTVSNADRRIALVPLKTLVEMNVLQITEDQEVIDRRVSERRFKLVSSIPSARRSSDQPVEPTSTSLPETDFASRNNTTYIEDLVSVAEQTRAKFGIPEPDSTLPQVSGDVLGGNRPQSFYDKQSNSMAEAERLRMMAQVADLASLDAIGKPLYWPHVKVLDIGAGDSTSLGSTIKKRNPNGSYHPIDIRDEAVSTHLAAGFEAKNGTATELPFPDSSMDVLHSRFTFGWLDKDGRERAVDEMLRVAKDFSRLAIVDYDWSDAGGPEPFNQLVETVTGHMRAFGFNPNYGLQMLGEIQSFLEKREYSATKMDVIQQRTNIAHPLEESLGVIEATALPLIEKLSEVGLQAEADLVMQQFEAVKSYAQDHPEEIITFPSIVSVAVRLKSPDFHKELREKIVTQRVLASEALKQELVTQLGPTELETYVLTSDDMKLQARKLHANAYFDHGYVLPEAVQEDGTLIPAIDAPDVIDSSIYLGTFNDEGTVTGCIRLIEPITKAVDEENAQAGPEINNTLTLPTVQKLVEAFDGSPEKLQELPFMQADTRVCEASALGKSSQSTDRTVTGRLILSEYLEAKKRGYDYVVMGVVEGTAKLITAFFGPESLKRIEGGEDIVIKSEGIRDEGIKLVPFYVEVDGFLQRCIDHFDKNPKSPLSKMHRGVFEEVQRYEAN